MKQLRKKAAPTSPAWHPDFRDPDSLPDVKVVRTSFFINGLGVLLFVGAALFLAVQEFRQQTLREEIQVLEDKIAEHEPRNNEAIRLHREFLAQQRYITEVAGYLDGSLDLSSLLVALGNSLHPEMTLTNIRYSPDNQRNGSGEKQILISGSIVGTPDVAASVITEYLNVFREDPFLDRHVAEAVSNSLIPTPEGDRMAFGIQLKMKSNSAAGEKKEETK